MRVIVLISNFAVALKAASLHPKSDFKYLVTFGDSYTDTVGLATMEAIMINHRPQE